MRISDWSSCVCFSDCPSNALGPVTLAAAPMSSMNRSMLSPTFAESGDRAMLAAAMVSAALRMLVIMSGFLRGEEVDAVLQFVGRKHAVSDRDRAPGHTVPQYRSEEHTSELQ